MGVSREGVPSREEANPTRLPEVRVLPAPCPISPFPSPGLLHLLPCSELLRAPDKHPLQLTRGPLRVWGAAGSRAARAACPSGAPTPNPAPGGSPPCWVPPASAAWPAEPPHATEPPMQHSPQPDGVNVAAGSILASSPGGPPPGWGAPRVGWPCCWAGSPQLPESLGPNRPCPAVTCAVSP